MVYTVQGAYVDTQSTLYILAIGASVYSTVLYDLLDICVLYIYIYYTVHILYSTYTLLFCSF